MVQPSSQAPNYRAGDLSWMARKIEEAIYGLLFQIRKILAVDQNEYNSWADNDISDRHKSIFPENI